MKANVPTMKSIQKNYREFLTLTALRAVILAVSDLSNSTRSKKTGRKRIPFTDADSKELTVYFLEILDGYLDQYKEKSIEEMDKELKERKFTIELPKK